MANLLFRKSFLYDTLDFDNQVEAKQIQIESGPSIKLIKRGVLEVVPDTISEGTKSIVLSAGIHGNETGPLELIDRLINDILDRKIDVKQHCLFLIGHPQATNQHTRFIDENLNRLFDNKTYPKTVESQLAEQHKATLAAFFKGIPTTNRWHLDLHCAIRGSKHYTFAVSPKVANGDARSREFIQFIERAKIEALLLSNAPTSTFSWYTAEYLGAKSLTVELGSVSPLGSNDPQLLADFDTGLRGLISDKLDVIQGKPPVTYRVTQTIKRANEDFGFNFADDVENFTQFEHGQVLGHDGDKLLFAKSDHEAVVFPNKKVAIGERAALMVCQVETRYQDDQLVYD